MEKIWHKKKKTRILLIIIANVMVISMMHEKRRLKISNFLLFQKAQPEQWLWKQEK